jgi:hypothetical protein
MVDRWNMATAGGARAVAVVLLWASLTAGVRDAGAAEGNAVLRLAFDQGLNPDAGEFQASTVVPPAGSVKFGMKEE